MQCRVLIGDTATENKRNIIRRRRRRKEEEDEVNSMETASTQKVTTANMNKHRSF
jgi:hypothetical protein